MHKGFPGYTLAIITLLATACAPAAASSIPEISASQPLAIVTTTGMISNIVETVGGERVTVTGLMGPGVDPHYYKPSSGDIRAMRNAHLVFYNGLRLEAGMAKVLERMENSRTKTVAVTRDFDRGVLLAPPEFAGAYDPHVWFDVSLWARAVETVRDTLVEMDARGADTYRDNAAAYLAELDELQKYIKEQAATIPVEKRVIITAHDAFNYFGRAYGFEVRGLQGISTVTEAGTGDVTALADFITSRQIPAIFIESSVPLRNIEAVQAAVLNRGFAVSIGGELFSDAMGTPGTGEGTYIGMIRHNVDTMVKALSVGN